MNSLALRSRHVAHVLPALALCGVFAACGGGAPSGGSSSVWENYDVYETQDNDYYYVPPKQYGGCEVGDVLGCE